MSHLFDDTTEQERADFFAKALSVAKQQHRADVLSQVEAKAGMIRVLRKEARSLLDGLPEEWVVRRTVLVQRSWNGGSGPPAGSQTFWGHKHPGTPFHAVGFVLHHADQAKAFKNPESAKLAAQCAADKDRGFDRQAWYKIEVVDRVDGEVLCQIDSRSEYIKAVDAGERNLEELRKLL